MTPPVFLLVLLYQIANFHNPVLGAPKFLDHSGHVRLGNPDERGKYLQGDIYERTDYHHSGTTKINLRWPNAYVFYHIDESFRPKEKAIILSAMREIRGKTCIRFQERSTERDYVHFINHKEDCWSSLGRQGGRQELNLGDPDCIVMGVVAHEILHTLGFFHEHARRDRDDYVSIIWSNVPPLRRVKRNFDRRRSGTISDFNLPYDYGSIMHYSPYAFAKHYRLPTIVPTEPLAFDFEIGQRRGLSVLDAQKLRVMYNLTNFKCDHDCEVQEGPHCRLFPSVKEDIKAMIGNPMVTFYTGLNMTGGSDPYQKMIIPHGLNKPHFSDTYTCYDLLAYKWARDQTKVVQFRSLNTFGSCIRVYTDPSTASYCAGPSVAIYPKIEQDGITLMDLETIPGLQSEKGTPGVYIRGVGKCFENELDDSVFELDAQGVKKYRKRLFKGINPPRIPDIYDIGPRKVPKEVNQTHKSESFPSSPAFYYTQGPLGRLEYLKVEIWTSAVVSNSDMTPTVEEVDFYNGLDRYEDDTIGYFISPFKFAIDRNLHFQIFPQSKGNREGQIEIEKRIEEYMNGKEHKEYGGHRMELVVMVDYDGLGTRPRGFSLRIIHEDLYNLWYANREQFYLSNLD